MKKLFNLGSLSPVIKNARRLPYPGTYRMVIADVETRAIKPVCPEQIHCLVVSFMLINVDTYESFDFVETYGVYKGNPRTEDFLAFLEYHGCDFLSDLDIVGLTAVVEVSNEYLGGYMHPTISFRPWALSRAIQGYYDETRSL